MRSQKCYHLFRRYGVTKEMFDSMMTEQQGLCKICKNPPAGKSLKDKVLHVDHNHVTKKVRGLLCRRCNIAVGWAERSELMQKCEAYLEENS